MEAELLSPKIKGIDDAEQSISMAFILDKTGLLCIIKPKPKDPAVRRRNHQPPVPGCRGGKNPA